MFQISRSTRTETAPGAPPTVPAFPPSDAVSDEERPPPPPARAWQLDTFDRTLKKRLKLRLLLHLLGPVERARCLLVTCGDNNGALNFHLRAAGGRWSWAELEEERIRDISSLLGEPVRLARADRLPFPDRSFDRVVAIDVHEHLDEVAPLNAELTRVLAPGGVAVITTPNGNPRLPLALLKRAVGMTPEVYGHRVAGYTIAQLEAQARQVGLEPELRGAYSRFFTEAIELALNWAYVKLLGRGGRRDRAGQGATTPGGIAPASPQELGEVGRAYRLYTRVYPLLRIVSGLDRFIPGRGGYAVAIAARKPGPGGHDAGVARARHPPPHTGTDRARTALVTGAAGFIGAHLTRRLVEEGWQVTALDREPAPPRAGHPAARWIRADVRELDHVASSRGLALDGVDTIFHLASAHLRVNAPAGWYESVNVGGATAVVRAAAEAGARRLVHVSSVGVYGHVPSPPAREDAPTRPLNEYERTKLRGEEAVLAECAARGVDGVVLRPSWVYGPGCPRTDRLLRSVRKGRFFFVGDGSNLRHPLFVSDALWALLLAADAAPPLPQGPYLIVGPRAVTVRELVEACARVQGVAAPRRRLPPILVRAVAGGVELAFSALGREPPVSRRSLAFFEHDNAFDGALAERELGFRAAIELEEGLRRTLAHEASLQTGTAAG